MLPERTSTKLTDTHKNNKRNLCNWVSLYPPLWSPPSSLARLLEQGVPFRGTKTSRQVDVFWPRADAPVVTFTQLPTPPLLLFCLPIVVVVTHTTWPQHTVHNTHTPTHTWYTLLPHTSYYCQAKPNKTWFIKWQHSLQFVSYHLEKEQWPMHDKPSGKKRKSGRERGIQRKVVEKQD